MSDKQFPPSIKRLNKARREGKVVKSRMVIICATWWVFFLLLYPTRAWVRNGTLIQWLNYQVWSPQMALVGAMREGALVLLVSVGGLALVALVVGMAQTKALFCPSQLTGGFQQYKPGAYLSRLRQNVVDSLVGCVRCLCIAFLVAPVLFLAGSLTPGISLGSFALFGSMVRSVMLRGAVALTVIAAMSYAIAWWKFMRQYRMSLQEMKDEHKEDEGDPHAKAARKHEHKMLLFAEIEKRVRRSKVVVVSRMPG